MTDRELDAAVARALGWTDIVCHSATNDMSGTNPRGIGRACGVPLYSTDIAAAWELVEAMEDMDPSLSYQETLCSWQIELVKGPSLGYVDSVCGSVRWLYADTAPRAICLAFLKSKGAL